MASSLSSDLSQDGTGKKKGLLMRSNAMCGDDDTQLRSLDPLDQQKSRTKHFSATSSVSRDSSHTDFTDSTGIDLLQFIVNTLHKNVKDREMLLNLESEMRKFVLDKSRQAYKFPKMSSYNRMLVHRVAAFFGLDHNIDQSGSLVVVTKTSNTRLPDVEFAKCIKNDIFTDRIFNARNVQSFDEGRLDNIYNNFCPVTPNTAFGSAKAIPVATGGSLSSLEMVRRAHSFEVGEWNNNMGGNISGSATVSLNMASAGQPNAYLVGTGGSNSSNSNSSWQLTSAGTNIPYIPSRPESMVSQNSGILVDPTTAVYYPAHQSSNFVSPMPYAVQPNEVPMQFYSQNNQSVNSDTDQRTAENFGDGNVEKNAENSQTFSRALSGLPSTYHIDGSNQYWPPHHTVPLSSDLIQNQYNPGEGNQAAYQSSNKPPGTTIFYPSNIAATPLHEYVAASPTTAMTNQSQQQQPPAIQYYIAPYPNPIPEGYVGSNPQQLADLFHQSVKIGNSSDERYGDQQHRHHQQSALISHSANNPAYDLNTAPPSIFFMPAPVRGIPAAPMAVDVSPSIITTQPLVAYSTLDSTGHSTTTTTSESSVVSDGQNPLQTLATSK